MKYSQRIATMSRLSDYEGDFLGLYEFAYILQLTKQSVSNRRSRGKLPVPLVELAMGPIWAKRHVMRWLRDDKEHLND